MSENNLFPRKKDIFQKSTKDVQNIVGRPSIDTQYQAIFSFGNYQNWLESTGNAIGKSRTNGLDFREKMSIMCTEAEIPGTSFETNLAVGHHQGIQEEFPSLRNFPPLNLTFYVDADHVILEVLETWMSFINPLKKGTKRNFNAYSRFNYPESYKEIMHITKFERDAFQSDKSRISSYEFVNVFPKNMTSMRVAYGETNVLRLSVTFVYDRFFTKFHYDDSLAATINTGDGLSNDTNTRGDSQNNRPWWLNAAETAFKLTPMGAGLDLGRRLYNNLFN